MTQEPKESWEGELPIVLRKFGYALVDWCEEKSPLEKVLEQENVVKQFITRLLNQERGRVVNEIYANIDQAARRMESKEVGLEINEINDILKKSLLNPKEQ